MKILILNWRDSKNPAAGGAERITEKYAKFWDRKGHKVYWLSNLFPSAKSSEVYDGVTYERIGPILSRNILRNTFVYPIYLVRAILRANRMIEQEKIDVVIDEIHGLPFLTPIYSRKRNVLLVCEVAGPIWDKMWSFPVNKIGKFMEWLIYYFYRNTEIWAISQNTKKDILSLNSSLEVKILPLGIETRKPAITRSQNLPKYQNPSAVFLGRLVKMKGVESAIKVADLIRQELTDFKLYIIGRGEPKYETHLKNLVKQKNLEYNVEFLGFISEEEKYKILAQSHFFLNPSFKEGFGLTVLEAGVVGTPAIVRSGSSLDELISDGEDGFIVQNEQEMVQRFVESWYGKKGFELGQNAWQKSFTYDWQKILLKSDTVTNL